VQVEGELVSRKRLEDLAPEQFSSILILADESATFSTKSDAEGAADSDSRNLATLLLLRDLQTKRMGREGLMRLHSASYHQKIRPSEALPSSHFLPHCLLLKQPAQSCNCAC
jgi:hypothetical protein